MKQLNILGAGALLVCALLLIGLPSVAAAQLPQGPEAGYWPYGCKTASGSTCGYAPADPDRVWSPFYAKSAAASASGVYCMPDSLTAPKGYIFSRLDIWSNAATTSNKEQLTVVARVAELRSGAWKDPTHVYNSDPTATYNTSFYVWADGNGNSSAIPGPWQFVGATEKIWLKASGTTAHWGWCAYCTPRYGSGATYSTVYATTDTGMYRGLTQ